MDALAPPSFLCPVGQELMRDPVTCADGHSYERTSIEQWLASHNTSPKTGAVLANNTLTPNHALRNSIEEWLTANFKLVPRSAVTFDERAIATGSFKTVHRGTLSGRSGPIAVLRMRAGGSCEEEAAKLVKLGRHEGLVRYLGLCVEGPEQLLLTELAEHGSLYKFLEDHEDAVTLPHKLTMMQQACGGMIALSGAGMVHRDLATRNILVFAFDANDPAATVVKITDFGLAVERLYQTHATVQGDHVPFRWMPPEALRRRRFSEKSDVWAFGVTAWELLTGGDVPYALIGSNEAVGKRVIGGERLPRPDGCPDALWALLQRMWAATPAERPTFTEIAGELRPVVSPPDTDTDTDTDTDNVEEEPPADELTWDGLAEAVGGNCPGCTDAPKVPGKTYFNGNGVLGLCSCCSNGLKEVLGGTLPASAPELRSTLNAMVFRSICLELPMNIATRMSTEELLSACTSAVSFIFVPEAMFKQLKTALLNPRAAGTMSPKAAADMIDECLEQGYLLSAAQAEDILADAGAAWDDYKYWHVLCHRVLDRWSLGSDRIGEHHPGVCYYGGGLNPRGPDGSMSALRKLFAESRTTDPKELARNILDQIFGRLQDYSWTSWNEDAHGQRVPAIAAKIGLKLASEM